MCSPNTDSTMIIPIRTSQTDDESLPEWAMLELNGELVKPKSADSNKSKPSSPSSSTASALVAKDQIELGSVRFTDEVRGFFVVVNNTLLAHSLTSNPFSGKSSHGFGQSRAQGVRGGAKAAICRHAKAKTKRKRNELYNCGSRYEKATL